MENTMRELQLKYAMRWLMTMCVASAISGCAANRTVATRQPATPEIQAAVMADAPVRAPHATADSSRHSSDDEISGSAEAAAQIVRLVGRDNVITITTGPHGPLYAATSPDGQVIAQAMTLDELRASRPDIYRQISGSASAGGQSGQLIADLGD